MTERYVGEALLIPKWHTFAVWALRVLFVLTFGCSAGITIGGLYFLHYFAAPSVDANLEKLRTENESLRVTIADYVKKINQPGKRAVPLGVGGP